MEDAEESLNISFVASDRLSGPPLHPPASATPLDLGHVVAGEEPLLSTKAARPPAWRIWTDTTAQLYTSDSQKA